MGNNSQKKRIENIITVLFSIAVFVYIIVILCSSDLIQEGDVVFFGCYEQDAIFDNGIEPIEWIVLSVNGTEATLISRYGLEVVKFDESKALTNIWSECSLRDWLNNVFLEKAFDDYEKNIIKTHMLHNPVNPFVDEQELYETEDKVYIPSYVDVLGRAWDEEYYYNVYSDELSQKWKCLLTKYAKEVLKSKFMEEYNIMYSSSSDRKQEEDNSDKGVYTYPWLLRTPGAYDGYVMGVSSTGQLEFGGYDICYSNIIRPMICVDISSGIFGNINDKLKITDHIPDHFAEDNEPELNAKPIYTFDNSDPEILLSLKTGDCIAFGSYEQNGNTNDGYEPIEWLVLSNDGEKILLLSRYILDYKQYNNKDEDISWGKCSLREWLNGDFYDTAFDSDEKLYIESTIVTNDLNPEYEKDYYKVKDKVFLLSNFDIINANYGFIEDYDANDMARSTSFTLYVKNNYDYEEMQRQGYKTKAGIDAGDWWLRSRSGQLIPVDEHTYMHQSGIIYGGKYLSGRNIDLFSGVRPAIYLRVST